MPVAGGGREGGVGVCDALIGIKKKRRNQVSGSRREQCRAPFSPYKALEVVIALQFGALDLL